MKKYVIKCEDNLGVFYAGKDIRIGYEAVESKEEAQVFQDGGMAYKATARLYTELKVEIEIIEDWKVFFFIEL